MSAATTRQQKEKFQHSGAEEHRKPRPTARYDKGNRLTGCFLTDGGKEVQLGNSSKINVSLRATRTSAAKVSSRLGRDKRCNHFRTLICDTAAQPGSRQPCH